MARGAPDWTRQVQVVITEGQPKNERAAGDAGRATITDTNYHEVASWTVAAGYLGELKEIIIVSSNYDLTQCKVTVGAVVYATDWQVVSPCPLIFEDLRLAAATVVKVEATSTTGASITVDAVIVGKEVG